MGVSGEEAATGARHPADPRGPLSTGSQIAQPPLTVEQVDDRQLPLGVGLAEMMDVHLLGAWHREQLAGERTEDRLRVFSAIGKQGQAAHARQQGIATGQGLATGAGQFRGIHTRSGIHPCNLALERDSRRSRGAELTLLLGRERDAYVDFQLAMGATCLAQRLQTATREGQLEGDG
jgi:hypothetical protein